MTKCDDVKKHTIMVENQCTALLEACEQLTVLRSGVNDMDANDMIEARVLDTVVPVSVESALNAKMASVVHLQKQINTTLVGLWQAIENMFEDSAPPRRQFDSTAVMAALEATVTAETSGHTQAEDSEPALRLVPRR